MNKLKAAMMVLVVFLSVPCTSWTQGRIFHYIKTHKELLASDSLVAGSLGADAGSSVHCQNVGAMNPPNGCTETNPFLGKHPGPRATFSLAFGEAAGLITLDHLLFHLTRDDKFTGHLIWLGTAPIAITEFFNVRSNVNVANELAQARARVGR